MNAIRGSRGANRLRRRLIAAVMAMSVVTVACGGEDDPADDGSGDGGGTFTIAAASQIATLDPQATTELTVHRVIGQIYDTLLVADEKREIHPHLATSFEISDDNLTYTFQLRDDVTFHNGEPFTADDVVFTFERWLSGESPNAWIIDGVKEIAAEGDHTVVMTLSEPRRDLLLNLARNDAALLNREAVEEAGDAYGTEGAIGTGPFVVESWTPTSDLVMTRNDDYTWGPEALYDNTGPAHLDQVVWRIIPDEQTRLLELQSGTVNALPPRLPFHEVANLEEAEGVEVMRFPLGSTVVLAFHTRSPRQDEEAVRRAILHGVDRQTIIDQVLYGNARLGDSLVAYGVPGHCDCADVIPQYDPAEAERLLESAGWEMGPDGIRERDGEPLEVVATVYDLVPYPEAYTVVQEQLRSIGVALDVQVIEAAQVFDMYRESTHGIWSTSIPHETPVQALFNFFHSSAVPDPNRFPWEDPETDALLDRMLSTTDEDEYLALSEEAQRRVLQASLFTPWWHEEGIVAVTSNVSGYEPYAYANHIFFKLLDTTIEE